MGNICTECQKCTVVIDQCEACELLPRRDRGAGNGSPGGSSAGYGRGGTGRESEAELMWQRGRLDLQQRWPGTQSPRPTPNADGAFAGGHLQRLLDDGSDATLQAAIAASHATLPPGFGFAQAPRQSSEEELLAQAIAASKMEEENRERIALIEEQKNEYEESLRVDRERALKQREEEKKRKEEEEARAQKEREEEQKRKELAEAIAKEEEEEKARIDRIAVLVEEARAKLGLEPPLDEPGRVTVRIRTPEGKALKRSFRGTDPVGQLYIYAIADGGELAGQEFRLIATMPRSVYEDREATLQEVGLSGQCALLVEIIETDEPGGE